jgi:hypothetical protein
VYFVIPWQEIKCLCAFSCAASSRSATNNLEETFAEAIEYRLWKGSLLDLGMQQDLKLTVKID